MLPNNIHHNPVPGFAPDGEGTWFQDQRLAPLAYIKRLGPLTGATYLFSALGLAVGGKSLFLLYTFTLRLGEREGLRCFSAPLTFILHLSSLW